jgi:thiamine phosphate synthase YjbQ (UPF0047 family)
MADQPRKKKPRAAKKRPPKKSAPPAPATDDAAEKAHVESLIVTGEAAVPNAEGKLPPGATHELSFTEEGEPQVVRRRFSAY